MMILEQKFVRMPNRTTYEAYEAICRTFFSSTQWRNRSPKMGRTPEDEGIKPIGNVNTRFAWQKGEGEEIKQKKAHKKQHQKKSQKQNHKNQSQTTKNPPPYDNYRVQTPAPS